MASQPPSAEFVDTRALAAITGLSTSHIIRLRLREPHNSPPFLHIGKRVVYPLNGPNGVRAWAERRLTNGVAA